MLCGIKPREINDVSLANSSYNTTEVQSDCSAEGETACVERDGDSPPFTSFSLVPLFFYVLSPCHL